MTELELRRRIGAAKVLLSQNDLEGALEQLEPFDVEFPDGVPTATWLPEHLFVVGRISGKGVRWEFPTHDEAARYIGGTLYYIDPVGVERGDYYIDKLVRGA